MKRWLLALILLVLAACSSVDAPQATDPNNMSYEEAEALVNTTAEDPAFNPTAILSYSFAADVESGAQEGTSLAGQLVAQGSDFPASGYLPEFTIFEGELGLEGGVSLEAQGLIIASKLYVFFSSEEEGIFIRGRGSLAESGSIEGPFVLFSEAGSSRGSWQAEPNDSGTPVPEPAPDPTDPEPTPDPAPEPDPTPEPEPDPTPDPEPEPDPTPDPIPEPTPEPDPEPEPEPDPTPDPIPEPEPTPDPEPEPTPDPAPEPDSELDAKCTPNITLNLEDNDPYRSGLFLEVSGEDPEAFLQDIGRKVCRILYKEANEVRDANNLELILRNEVGSVAWKSGDIGDITIMISTDHLKNVDQGGGNVADEVKGILFHEITHMYQQDDKDGGGVDLGLIEGIADFVRFQNGYAPAGAQPNKNGNWNDGYRTTAFFLVWLDETYPEAIYELNKSMDNTDGESWSPASFEDITGKSVDALWQDYVND